MQLRDELSFGVRWDNRNILMFGILLILPNILGLFNIHTSWGFKIHLFQVAIFIGAIIYGPAGGALTGMVGSVYSAFATGNPYIIGGNIILGFFAGLLIRRGMHALPAVWIAFLIQLPWLFVTDYYLMHLPMSFITALVIALAISNTLWALAAKHISKPLKQGLAA